MWKGGENPQSLLDINCPEIQASDLIMRSALIMEPALLDSGAQAGALAHSAEVVREIVVTTWGSSVWEHLFAQTNDPDWGSGNTINSSLS